MNIPKNAPLSPDLIDRTQPQTLGQSLDEKLFDAGNAARHWYANMQTGMLKQAPGLAAALGYKPVDPSTLGFSPTNQAAVQAPSQMIVPRMR